MSTKRKTPLYCWDTSVFIAWLNEEESAPLSDIECILDKIYHQKATLLFPVTVFTEVLRAKHSDEQIELFNKFLERSNVVKADTTFEVAKKAEHIRSEAIETGPKSQKKAIKTPDATIIATAIVYEADVLHSMEPKHHNLSESDLVDGLRITLPQDISGQKTLL